MTKIILSLGGLPSITRSSQYVFLAAYLFALVCLVAAYSGNLMAYLAIDKQSWPFTTLEGFAESDYGLYLSKGSSAEEIVKVTPVTERLEMYTCIHVSS